MKQPPVLSKCHKTQKNVTKHTEMFENPHRDMLFGRQGDFKGDVRVLEVGMIQGIQVAFINAL